MYYSVMYVNITTSVPELRIIMYVDQIHMYLKNTK